MVMSLILIIFFFFNDTATTEIYTLSLHDALPICRERTTLDPHHEGGLQVADRQRLGASRARRVAQRGGSGSRSEEHTSELQSRQYLVCRLLLEKKKHKRLYSCMRISSASFNYILH